MAARRKSKPRKNRGGRPTKLTAKVHAEIVDWLDKGAYKKHAAEAAGVSVDAVDLWLGKGEPEDAPEPFRKFFLDVRKAQAKHVVDRQAIITKAAITDWKAVHVHAVTH